MNATRETRARAHRVLVVIPARGGSKGIPRKNLSVLNGRPLIAYAVQTALDSRHRPEVVVSSDDEEILQLASRLGARPHRRAAHLADDACTLDPVIHDAYQENSNASAPYELIVTLQPTSPLLKSTTLDQAIEHMLDGPDIDTLISAQEDTHLTWRRDAERFVPNYAERVNRQYLPKTYRETGAFLITRPAIISASNRIGEVVDLFLLGGGEEIDIDTYEDWSLCEFFLRRRVVLFVVSGHAEIGLGHAYRTLLLASGMLNHRVIFLVDRRSQLAYDKIAENNYEVHIQGKADLSDEIAHFEPNVVINDLLDTRTEYVEALKRRGATVINFEDLGPGARSADLVINALYPEQRELPNHHFGESYFCARDEFIYSPTKKIEVEVSRVLISFGGVDPNNLTRKTLAAIYDECRERDIDIHVVLGLGYTQEESLNEFTGATIRRNVRDISAEMLAADMAFTSAGRTIYELACIGTPTIVLTQNERESTHLFASRENGFQNLGLGIDASADDIVGTLRELADDFDARQAMNQRMLEPRIRSGRQRVLRLIQQTIEKA